MQSYEVIFYYCLIFVRKMRVLEKYTKLVRAGYILFFCFIVFGFTACSSSKFMEEGEYVLSKVSVVSSNPDIKVSPYRRYVRQEPNSKWFNLIKVPLGIYCMSGTDSTKGINRFIRRLGEPPVIYDSLRTKLSERYIKQALNNKGFLHAQVSALVSVSKRKVKVVYQIDPGKQYKIRSIQWHVDNACIDSILQANRSNSLLHVGMPCDVNLLDQERMRIFKLLQDKGFYKIHKEFVSFRADSCEGSTDMDLKVRFHYAGKPSDTLIAYQPFRIGKIRVYSNLIPGEKTLSDSISDDNIAFYYKKRMFLRPKLLSRSITLRPGQLYSEQSVQQTYRNISRLPIVQYSVVRMHEDVYQDTAILDCSIFMKSNLVNSVSAELEGTNTAGDLGAAASLTFTNRNMFHGGELFTIKLRGAYEAITGLEGYNDQNYVELGIETNLRLPHSLLPFPLFKFRHLTNASTDFSLMYDSQNRPEFHRRVLTAAWSFRWSDYRNKWSHKLDFLSLNYVFMPWISDTFQKNYLDSADSRNSILRYNYENLFIMNTNYSFVYNSSMLNSVLGIYQTNAYQIRFNVETAGNLLYGLSALFGAHKNLNGQHTILGIAYAQYAKFDFEYAKSFLINERNSVAFRLALGMAFPYGNASILPYEKRYFSGGANSVRGWSVRELGPGSFSGKDGKIDFINQTGDIKLDLSLEYRTYLFWKLHGAFFIDAGNIWTLRNYAEQPGGQFDIIKFYRQIAVSYGLGFRLNFDYFILRFDMGMKAVNPAYTTAKQHYPFLSPNFRRDFTFHFAVGLPF